MYSEPPTFQLSSQVPSNLGGGAACGRTAPHATRFVLGAGNVTASQKPYLEDKCNEAVEIVRKEALSLIQPEPSLHLTPYRQ